MAIGIIDIGRLGRNLPDVPPMSVTVGGSAAAGPSPPAVRLMGGTLMIGSAAAVTVPLGNMGKIPGNTTKQCIGSRVRSGKRERKRPVVTRVIAAIHATGSACPRLIGAMTTSATKSSAICVTTRSEGSHSAKTEANAYRAVEEIPPRLYAHQVGCRNLTQSQKAALSLELEKQRAETAKLRRRAAQTNNVG